MESGATVDNGTATGHARANETGIKVTSSRVKTEHPLTSAAPGVLQWSLQDLNLFGWVIPTAYALSTFGNTYSCATWRHY